VNKESVFSPRLLALWIVAGALTFAASLYFMTQGEQEGRGGDTVGPSAFSRSVIGYAGIAEILKQLGFTVVKSEADAVGKLDDGSILVLAEPRPATQSAETLKKLIGESRNVLLILPKWLGRESMEKPGWVEEVLPVPQSDAQWALDLAVEGATVERVDDAVHWTENELAKDPEPSTPIQLLRSKRLHPVVAAGDRILLGDIVRRGRRVWVLADPGVIDNHGLSEESNVEFAVALMNAIHPEGKVVFDETLHGYVARTASPLKLLFEQPFVFATIQGILALALLFWATARRFGAPEPAPPALAAGKQGLIDNAARLLEFAGHQPVMVQRYVEASLRDAARQLHAPRGLGPAATLEWLDRVGTARAVGIDCTALWGRMRALAERRRPDLAALLDVARQIHAWKRKIVDGPAGNSGPH